MVEQTTLYLGVLDEFGGTTMVACKPIGMFSKLRKMAQKMFESFKAGLLNLVGNARPRKPDRGRDTRLATAVLLTCVTTVHCESEKLRELLNSGFGIDDDATTQLIERAAKAVRYSVDLYRFPVN